MAEWIAEGEPSLDLWEMDIRRFGAQYRSPAYTHARIKETYETYYDIRYPNHERSAGRPLRVSPANAWHREHGAAFGEKSGWERVNWYESNAAAGRRVAAPARLGRPALVAGDRRRAPRHARGAWRSSTRPRSPSWRSRGPGAAELLERLCDNRVARERRQDHLHADAQPPRRDRVRLHRRAPRRGALLDRHRHRLRQPRPRVDPPPPSRRTAASQVARRRPRSGPASGSGGRGRATCSQPLTPADLGNEAFPYMSRARDHRRRRAGAGAARDLRRRARLGALLPDRVRARAVAGALGGGRAARDRRRRLPGDRLDAPREGLPGLGRRHHPGRDARTRAASASASSSTRRAGSSAARRWSRRRSAARARGSAACCSRTRARSRSATSRCGSTARFVGRVTTGGYGYTVERSIAYAYLPPEHAEPGTAVEVEIFGELGRGRGRRRAPLRPQGRADSC